MILGIYIMATGISIPTGNNYSGSFDKNSVLNILLPDQNGHSTNCFRTDGNNTYWDSNCSGSGNIPTGEPTYLAYYDDTGNITSTDTATLLLNEYYDLDRDESSLIFASANSLSLYPITEKENVSNIGKSEFNWNDLFLSGKIRFFKDPTSSTSTGEIYVDSGILRLTASNYVNILTDLVVNGVVTASNLSGTNTGDSSGHTGLIPYTGATTNVNLGANNLTIDTNTFFVDSNLNRLGLGTITPAGTNHTITSGSEINYVSEKISNDTIAPQFQYRKSRGTVGALTAIQAGDALINIAGIGYDGTRYPSSASSSIRAAADENFTTTAMGSYIFFSTTPKGTTSQVQRMRIASDGNIGMKTTTPVYDLDVNGKINSAIGYYANGTAGIDKNINIQKSLTTTCDMNFIKGILIASNC